MFTDEDLIGSKLLGDVARFMVQVSGLKPSFLEAYVDLLRDWETEQDNTGVADVNLYSSLDNQTRQEDIHFSYAEVGQIDSSELPINDTLEGPV